MISSASPPDKTALLLSGGLDSAILLGHLLDHGQSVRPIYVRSGCGWERAERSAVRRFVAALGSAAVEPLVELKMPVVDLYGDHWSTTNLQVPDGTTPDEAVHLFGRNTLLLVKALLWCQLHEIRHLALATLASNPFADASPEFFEQFAKALQTASAQPIEVLRPFERLSKTDVLEIGKHLPLQLTFSCLAPRNGYHCGQCNKCAERNAALQSLPGGDPTVYAQAAGAAIASIPPA